MISLLACSEVKSFPIGGFSIFVAACCGGSGGTAILITLVLGVDRKKSGALAPNGANWVINDFSKITADQIVTFFAERSRAA